MLCDELFTERCRIKHPDLNFSHDEKWRTGKNTALKQAVSVLLQAEKVLIDNGNPDNHGEKRYLEKALLKGAGGLKKTGSEGVVSYFSCETDPAKIHDDFPVFKELCERLVNLNPGEIFSVGAFLEEARTAPYGVGGTPLMLLLAHVIRAYGERLIVYKDSTRMVEQPIETYDDLVKIVSDPAAKTVFVIRDISEAQITLIDLVARAVDAPPLKHGETRSLNSAFEMLKQWWNGLPAVAKVIGLYEEDRKVRLTSLKNLMDGLPYRIWQIHNRQYDEELEQTVARFSDWYIREYASIHKDSDLSLTHCLSRIASRDLSSEFTIILVVDCLPIAFMELLDQALRNVGPRPP